MAVFKEDTIVKTKIVSNKKLDESLVIIFDKFKIKHAIVSSVVKLLDKTVTYLSSKIETIVLNSKTEVPFNNLYKTPKTLGVDRIALVSAAKKMYLNKNVLVIDAGTCITYDFISDESDYFGGAISPGLHMRYDAMHHFTANLPKLSPKANIVLGDSTENAMHQGVVNGLVLEIDGIINQYLSKYNNLTIVLTGGDTNFLAKLLKSSIFANPNFLLEGLNHILNYNIKK
jgi:type III pantothenate kinase